MLGYRAGRLHVGLTLGGIFGLIITRYASLLELVKSVTRSCVMGTVGDDRRAYVVDKEVDPFRFSVAHFLS